MQRRQFLKQAGVAIAGAPALLRAQAPAKKPNVVLIYADDLGWGDLGCYGGKLSTPHLDRMAAEGTRFTQFYSANPVCSPSRAALLTGRYPTRVGVPRVFFPQDTEGLNEDETTIAQMLKPLGYRTHCVGKWHLGRPERFLPTNRGFDGYFGIPYSNDMNPRPLMRDTAVIEPEATLETLTSRYTEEALKFIDGSRDQPFFLYMPHTYPHIPLAASPRFRGKSPHGIYGDVLSELDWSVGEVLAALKRNRVDENTLVLFSSDNGPWFQGSPGFLRGRKGMTWEGGVRVPLIARMPGRVARGRTVDGIGSTMDLLPTIGKLVSAQLPSKPLDGIDIWPMLAGSTRSIDRDLLLYFDGWNVQCARWKQWKIHVARYNNVTYSPAPQGGRINFPLVEPELYALTRDPDESYDVAAENVGVVREMMGKIETMVAGFPDPVRKAWAETRERGTAKVPAGSLPRGKAQ